MIKMMVSLFPWDNGFLSFLFSLIMVHRACVFNTVSLVLLYGRSCLMRTGLCFIYIFLTLILVMTRYRGGRGQETGIFDET